MKRDTLINLILSLISVVIFVVFPTELALRIVWGILSPLLCFRVLRDAYKRARKKSEEPHLDRKQFYFNIAPAFFLSFGFLAFYYTAMVLPEPESPYQYLDLSFWLFTGSVLLWLIFRAIADTRDGILLKKFNKIEGTSK